MKYIITTILSSILIRFTGKGERNQQKTGRRITSEKSASFSRSSLLSIIIWEAIRNKTFKPQPNPLKTVQPLIIWIFNQHLSDVTTITQNQLYAVLQITRNPLNGPDLTSFFLFPFHHCCPGAFCSSSRTRYHFELSVLKAHLRQQAAQPSEGPDNVQAGVDDSFGGNMSKGKFSYGLDLLFHITSFNTSLCSLFFL